LFGVSHYYILNGSKLIATIKLHFVLLWACKLPSSGTKTFLKQIRMIWNKREGLIDFGTGECDALATITPYNERN
jgi:hypothetical protein